ncbi:TonB-dependent hemoglobin/transferrin/lactoferrin family receptor [Psychromonas sp. Urea-02u-13]|uniref:TonB-dependent hemoglobin/transferrin/lactoferrin family receptor n=1 Tax=Psychromonas sp. Urea-02u-13 TaxID=2058326 RepID=UPI000C3327FC|nr:TonB-dependent hemoglobin/transferrin/lactoferrin family receptor [Psychromonas sp. Urea-02u-13]PKG37891.1 ligand-gated channel [Psychromonas sp. Urea-02u-13]
MKLSRISASVLAALTAGIVHAESNVNNFETIVVTANKYEEDLSKTAGSVAVITGEDLDREGATELYDALNREPGVSVTGGAGRPQNITIRGLTGNRITIVKDGIAMPDGYGAADINNKVGRNAFDLSTLKQIQVVKGASSTVYGSGAIGGAVILQSKTPEDFLKGDNVYVDTSGIYTGISNKYKLGSNLAFRAGDSTSLISVSYWTGEETRNYEQDLYNREMEGVNGAYTFHYDLNEHWLLKAKAEFYREEVQRQEGISSLQPDGLWNIKDFDEETTQSTYTVMAGAEYFAENTLFDSMDAKAYLRYSENEEHSNRLMYRENNGITELRRELENLRFRDDLVGLSTDFYKEFFNNGLLHNLVYGAIAETSYHERPVSETTSDWNGNSTSSTNPFAPARSYSIGVFAQDAISIDKWTAMLGLRFDMHRLSPEKEDAIAVDGELKSNSSSELSPSASLAYQFTPEVNVYISYKHGYRAPEYDKTYGYVNHDFVPITPFEILPNFNLEAETSDNFELGSKYDNGVLRVYGAVFYSDFDNFIGIADQGFNAQTGLWQKQYANLNGVNTYGAEITVAYIFDQNWSANTKAGWVNGKDDNDEYIRSLTPLEGNVELNYDHTDFNAYARLNWADAMNRTPSCSSELGLKTECAQTSSWATFDLGAGYSITQNFDVNVNVINLLDRQYTRYQDVAGVSESATRFSTEPGRYFTVNARYAF